MDHGQGELTGKRLHVQLAARIEPTHAQSSRQALGQPAIVQVTGETKTRVKGILGGKLSERPVGAAVVVGSGEEIVIGVAGTQVIVRDGVAAASALDLPALKVMDFRESKEEGRLRRLLGDLVQATSRFVGIFRVDRGKVELAQGLLRPRR
jgi:hypothetical protein